MSHPLPRRSVFAAAAVLILASALGSRSEAADIKDPKIQNSVNRAADYLRKQLAENKTTGTAPTGQKSLAAYALIKAGEPPTNPSIQRVLDGVVSRTDKGNYSQGSDGHYAIYTAGADLMLLEAADPERYREAMQVIVNYICSKQHSSGAWDYIDGFRGGDTSQSQYALLGLWSAARAGLEIPIEVWDMAAQWFINTQFRDGSFAYHPRDKNPEFKVPMHSTTVAGVGSLMICKRYLFRKNAEPPQEKPQNTRKFGVLEQVDLDKTDPSSPGETRPRNRNYQPTTSLKQIDSAIDRGLGWFGRSYRIRNVGIWSIYYLYTIERMAALAEAATFAGHDWYREGADFLISSQDPKEGTWTDRTTLMPATSFGILFLTRATARVLDQPVPDLLGSGLLAGGRGLPDNLSQAVVRDGKVEEEKELGAIDQLLAELEKVDSVDIAETQQAIVEKIKLGDREELIQQKDLLVRLARHSNWEVRRTALWAIGRTEDVGLAGILYKALDDDNVDVMIEARNAFCILSRKPLGFGLPDNPFEDLPNNAGEKERRAAVAAWREKLKATWGEWYYKYRPYDQRDDLGETLFEAKRK